MSQRPVKKPSSESPFGAFPGEYTVPKKKFAEIRAAEGGMTLAESRAASKAVATTTPQSEFLRGHTRSSNLSSSTRVGKKPSAPDAPQRAKLFHDAPNVGTEFRRFYNRGDLPVSLQHSSGGRRLDWKMDIDKLDYHHYLPIFFDGLREKEEPFAYLAQQGCADLLKQGGPKILATIPQLIIPLKTALNTRDRAVICNVLKVMQQLVTSAPLVGQALVPYYRQLLPTFNLCLNVNKNLGDAMDYAQRKRETPGELIHETLQLLEIHGGDDAFINIKYMVPTYESCVPAQ